MTAALAEEEIAEIAARLESAPFGAICSALREDMQRLLASHEAFRVCVREQHEIFVQMGPVIDDLRRRLATSSGFASALVEELAREGA